MPLPVEVGIGNPPIWHAAEAVLETALPELEQPPRDLLPGDVRFEYWETRAGRRGGPTETFWVRLLLHNGAATPPTGAVLVPPGEHRTYVSVRDTPEIDTVETQRLLAR